jgi:hypothetical protein
MNLMKNAYEKVSDVKEEAGEGVSTKLQTVVKRNPGCCIFTSV